jgi:transglycosylase-like protein
MRTLQRRTSALAVAVVMAATLLASDPFTEVAGAQPARRWARSASGRTPHRIRASRSGRARPRGPSSAMSAGDVWARLRHCESGGRYDRNSGNGFYGAYQFLPSTWRNLGFRGLPHEAAPEVQDAAARVLQVRSGWGQWPVCSRRIGAR